jgi:glycogen operon protein
VTCHDGFTLRDLVSYNGKHNEANREDNRDGSDDNASWNTGAEGETDDPEINRLRRQRAKNFICHLMFSAGTPMLLGGDELLRTQRGNNNAYCQDNEISWFDWSLRTKNRDFFEFVRRAIAFRRKYPVLMRRAFFTGRDINKDSRLDIQWYGMDLAPPDWGNPDLRTIAYQLDGAETDQGAGDYLVFVILNASWNAHGVRLPDPGSTRRWRRVLDTSLEAGEDFLPDGRELLLEPADHYVASARSTVVLLARA